MVNTQTGILRSSPRYSSCAPNPRSICGTDDARNRPRDTPARARPVRSLADLVKCSVQPHEEVYEIRVAEEEEVPRVASCPAAGAADDDVAHAASMPNSSPLNEDDVPSSDDENDDLDINNAQDLNNESVGSNDEEDEEILIMLGLSDLLHESCNVDAGEDVHKLLDVRPFRKLWETLMQWATPSTTKLVYQYHDMTHDLFQIAPPIDGETAQDTDTTEGHFTRNTVEIGASRRAGIMNMLRMNVSRSLSELKNTKQYDVSDRRRVEKRLANLVKTFDCAGNAADFDMKLWRGMTTILIAIVSPAASHVAVQEYSSAREDEDAVLMPQSIVTLGLLPEEYRYLTKTALMSLSNIERLNED